MTRYIVFLIVKCTHHHRSQRKITEQERESEWKWGQGKSRKRKWEREKVAKRITSRNLPFSESFISFLLSLTCSFLCATILRARALSPSFRNEFCSLEKIPSFVSLSESPFRFLKRGKARLAILAHPPPLFPISFQVQFFTKYFCQIHWKWGRERKRHNVPNSLSNVYCTLLVWECVT